jgi:uncharacterized membrane protein YeaQ/YmgE (transglycosylase-associated protein family)
MGILIWLISGLVIGSAASFIAPAEIGRNILRNVLLGITGALAGGVLMTLVGESGPLSSYSYYGVLVAIIGACTFIAVLGPVQSFRYKLSHS